MSLIKTNEAVEQSCFTYHHYQQWSEDERWQIIDGEAFAMSPAPTIIHHVICFLIAKKLSDLLNQSQCQVFISPVDVLLPKADEEDNAVDTIVQPDVLIVCDKDKIREKNIKGAPDFIVEVLSPSTAKLDEGIKRDLYQNAGVKEYWLVHPLDKTINQYQFIGRYLRKLSLYFMQIPSVLLSYFSIKCWF
ncbi:MAG: Uma2 family endonuclease [gamma proteobacterium symbiont of Taylorina sp.]|nr:Uma2 family endonuclease [gamma proteobacterium symbiont of Taylorina sp.]